MGMAMGKRRMDPAMAEKAAERMEARIGEMAGDQANKIANNLILIEPLGRDDKTVASVAARHHVAFAAPLAAKDFRQRGSACGGADHREREQCEQDLDHGVRHPVVPAIILLGHRAAR